MRERVPFFSIVLVLVGAVLLALSFVPNHAWDNKLLGDALEFVSTVIILVGACFIVYALSGDGVATGLFAASGVLLVISRLLDVTEGIHALTGIPVLGGGAGNTVMTRILESAGCVFLLWMFFAILNQTRKLRLATEEVHQRYLKAHEATLYLARVADMCAEAVIGCDGENTVRSWNLGAKELFGYSSDEAVGMPLTELIVEGLDGSDDALLDRVSRTGSLRDLEVTILDRKGATILAGATVSPVYDDRGNSVGVSVVVRDIEQRRKAEQELVASRDLLAGALQAVDVGIFIFDRHPRLIAHNPRVEELTGFTAEELMSLDTKEGFRQLMGPSHFVLHALRQEVLERGRQTEYRNLTIHRKDGEKRICNLAISPVRNESGDIIAAAGAVVDITEREELHAQLLASQKMESLGRMAGGIAHDFNNILAGVLGYSSLLKEKLASEATLSDYAQAVEDSARRASELTQQLLAFAKGAEFRLEAVSLNTVARETTELFSYTLDPNIRASFVPFDGSDITRADSSQIKQVLMNLLINARDAIQGAGRIRVWVEERSTRQSGVAATGTARKPDLLCLVVEDTGSGMAPEVAQRVFEPFFSTKEHSDGFGLGLSVVYGIVQAHGGRIEVHSEVGAGTRVEVSFPRCEGAPTTQPRRTGPFPRTAVGTETILVVDDEELVRRMTRDVLATAGYRVLIAPDGAAAIEIFREHGDEIALVVLDLVMPGVGGVDALEALRELKPGLPCVFASGFDAGHVAELYRDDASVRSLPKPFEAAALAGHVRDLLDADTSLRT